MEMKCGDVVIDASEVEWKIVLVTEEEVWLKRSYRGPFGARTAVLSKVSRADADNGFAKMGRP